MRGIPWWPVLGGALLLAAGLVAAHRTLPEWRADPGARAGRATKVQRDLAAVGGELQEARLSLSGAPAGEGYERAFHALGPGAAGYLTGIGGAVWYRVSGHLAVQGAGSGAFDADLAPDGSYRGFTWYPGGMLPLGAVEDGVRQRRDAFGAELERLLAGATPLGPARSYVENNVPIFVSPLVTGIGRPAESILRIQPLNGVTLKRQIADPAIPLGTSSEATLQRLLTKLLPSFASICLVLPLFGWLLHKRRLDFRIGLGLAALAVFSSVLTGPAGEAMTAETILRLGAGLVAVAYLVAQWAVAESFLRDTVPDFTTSLDSLAAGRLGPRAGRALLAGLGAGAALEGLALLLFSAAVAAAPSAYPTRPSFSVPFFRLTGNAFYEGAAQVSALVLLVALLRSILPRKWADPAGGLAAALLFSLSVPLAPWGAALAVAIGASVAGLLILRRFGFASLLAAATAAPLFRDTFASAHLLSGNLPSFVLAAGALGALLALGVAGLLRTGRDEEGRVAAPGYLKRLEAERRVKYEMDLLSRMQLALLPEKAPEVSGLRIAFRSALATEAGGDLYDFRVDRGGSLWVAAGDVSGHGYSCGIQGAMVKAALLSLVKAGRRPGEILGEIDEVLRAAGRTRLFTTLALARIDPATGEGVWANAGHPFPFLVVEGACRELSSPGLPLGQGPPRVYPDIPFEVPPRGVLVFASDGLFEGVNPFDEPYGYDRPRTVLSSTGLWRRPADGIVEALFSDWRRHVGEGAPADDTTVVVLKRAG